MCLHQEFGLARFKSNQAKAMKGLEYALSKIQGETHTHISTSAFVRTLADVLHLAPSLNLKQSHMHKKLITKRKHENKTHLIVFFY